MSNPFLQPVGSLRQVKTRRGDTLQKIAARELGDASQWHTLIGINGLAWPFITDDVVPIDRVIRTGTPILVPSSSASAVPDASADPDKTFGVDVALTKGKLTATNGDLTVVRGTKNLAQALRHRLVTRRGELTFHQSYGNEVYTIIGKGGTRPNAVLANAFIRRAVGADPRVVDTKDVTASLSGDQIAVSGNAVATDGTNQPVLF